MEQSASAPEALLFRSPLPMSEVRSRINGKCLNRLLGFVLYFQRNPAELFGKVRDRRVRLQAPSVLNNSEPMLLGTLEDAPDGGNSESRVPDVLRGWSRGASYNSQQEGRIIGAIARITGLVVEDAETA
jgi:hypothetical protein